MFSRNNVLEFKKWGQFESEEPALEPKQLLIILVHNLTIVYSL